jgi:outer membrane protein assembly factor BamD
MRRFLLLIGGVAAFSFLGVPDCPAPLVWRRGEGWTYERAGVTTGKDPKEQLDIARQLHAARNYDHALTAYRRLVRRWPTSFFAQEARLGAAECLSALGYHYKAFREYQLLIEKHPNTEYFNTVLQRQFEIGNLFLAGEKQKVWRFRLFPAVEKAPLVFARVVKNGPYSEIAPQAQFRIGLAYEKLKAYTQAVRAYEVLLEHYPRHPIAAEAQFHIGWAYKQESARSEYDQHAANRSIEAFQDFLIGFPDHEKTPEAQAYLVGLKQEQARGLFRIGEFYEKKKHYKSALIYYNEVIEQNPESNWAVAAHDKVAKLSPHNATASTATP